ncbi:MAG: hypothetical protein HY665_01185, partial [Chloroflexi bacterium]|nr:hypothetical protein [Chloroflexota bacterium]
MRIQRKLIIGISIVVLAALIAGCSSNYTPPGSQSGGSTPPAVSNGIAPRNGLAQSNEGGAVTIQMKWLGEKNGSLQLQVTMDTHSVDLDRIDLKTSAVLRDDSGKEYRPTAWDSAAGGHHRQGTLTFAYPDSIKQGKAKYIEVVIRDVAG